VAVLGGKRCHLRQRPQPDRQARPRRSATWGRMRWAPRHMPSRLSAWRRRTDRQPPSRRSGGNSCIWHRPCGPHSGRFPRSAKTGRALSDPVSLHRVNWGSSFVGSKPALKTSVHPQARSHRKRAQPVR